MPERLPLVKCTVCRILVRTCNLEKHLEKHLAKHPLLPPPPGNTIHYKPVLPQGLVLILWLGEGVRFKTQFEPKPLMRHILYHNSNRVWFLTKAAERKYPLTANKRLFKAGDIIELYFPSSHGNIRLQAKAEQLVRVSASSEPSKTALPFKAIYRG